MTDSNCTIDDHGKGNYELYVQGLMDGKSKYRAALDAGFSKNKAAHASLRIEGPVTQKLMQAATDGSSSGGSRSQRYVDGLMEGKSKAQSALDAGFTVSQARTPQRLDTRITQELLRNSLARAEITLDALASKLRAGLDATRTLVLPGAPGTAPTLEKVEDFHAQLRFIQHAHKLLFTTFPEEQEPQQLTVRIIDVADMDM